MEVDLQMKPKTGSKLKPMPKIPTVPFTDNEVYALTNYDASEFLLSRLRIWRASDEFQFIEKLEDLVIRNFPCRKASEYEKELRKLWVNWLVSFESDKFKALKGISLKGTSLEPQQDVLAKAGVL